ncbi:translation initiation factor IF-2-like [Plutella xylostella]|uniref:translation initiation factor IF-2-like n=1 Tax=Plutella xylostella TaxID=51655 RepID=UPI002032FCA4|nr:translation initiation factor IF-2-like [Plutella xylostella]
MNSAPSDASTSTDDLKSGVCVWYLPAGCALLCPSPRPGRLAAGMSPPAPRAAYELGAAAVHARPLALLRRPRSPPPASSDWLPSSSPSPRRAPHRLLPPLHFPLPRDDLQDSSDDFWSQRRAQTERRCLPPLQLPPPAPRAPRTPRALRSPRAPLTPRGPRTPRAAPPPARAPRRAPGVSKHKRRARLSGLRRALACLMQRTVRGEHFYYPTKLQGRKYLNCTFYNRKNSSITPGWHRSRVATPPDLVGSLDPDVDLDLELHLDLDLDLHFDRKPRRVRYFWTEPVRV